MKKIILAIALFSVINFNQPLAHSTPTNPTTISYQGVLTDGNDDLLADGEHSVTFKLYDVLSNGSALWTETQTVSTTNGLFNVDLGSVTGVTGVDFTKQLYLEVTVESIVLSPRIKFTAQPYAFIAKTLGETLPLTKGGTGASTTQGAKDNLGITTLETEVSGLNDDVSTLETNVTSLQSDVSTLETNVSSLQSNVSTLETNVSSLQSDVSTLETNVTSMNNDVTDLETEVSALGTISTQSASSVAITGGTVNGTSVGATSASTGKFTSTETGTLKVTGGTPGTGKVLTSDANGTATWADAASGGTINLATGVTGTLPLANGGTGSTTAAGARTNLELGTISTQSASSVAITGGTVNGTSVGATSASTGKFTSTETGTIKITGGTPGAGKVLTSDANGTGTWETASGGGGSLSMSYQETGTNGNIGTTFTTIFTSSTLSAGTYLVETNLLYAVNTVLEINIQAGSTVVSGTTSAAGTLSVDFYRGLTSIVTLSTSETISVRARGSAASTFSNGLLKIVKLF